MSGDWKEYQEEAAKFFRSLGLSATVECHVEGVRGEHDVDVYVEGDLHGINFKWVVECKAWKSNIPKEKAMVLMSIVQDVGADRGFLLSETGFQSGAIRAVRGSNITLTSLDDLRELVEEDLVESTIVKLSWRTNRVLDKLRYLHKQTDNYQSHFLTQMGKLSLFPLAFEDALEGKYPNIYAVESDGGETVRLAADSFEELIGEADKILSEIEEYADSHSE